MNTIKIFENEQFGKVRIAMSENNEPFFCLADVCQILDLIPSKVAQRLDKDVLSKYPLETAGGIQQANFVDEDGLYDTILDSRKPEAKKFRKWVTSEVLPCIRKTRWLHRYQNGRHSRRNHGTCAYCGTRNTETKRTASYRG